MYEIVWNGNHKWGQFRDLCGPRWTTRYFKGRNRNTKSEVYLTFFYQELYVHIT